MKKNQLVISMTLIISAFIVFSQSLEVSAAEVTQNNLTSSAAVEELLLEGLQAHQAEINLSDYNITVDQFKAMYRPFLKNHPELFFVENSYNYYAKKSGKVTRILPIYSENMGTLQQQELETVKNQILGSVIKDGMSQRDKVKAVHDYLVMNCKYDTQNYLNNTVPRESCTAYGALVKKVAVCDGYACAMNLLLNEVGVECVYVASKAMGHGWNRVKVDGVWYHVDTTWDVPASGSQAKVSYQYFLLTDEQIQTVGEVHYGWN